MSYIDLAKLSMPTGFKTYGEAPGDGSGCSVSSVGDINKDGYDDFIIGASAASPLVSTIIRDHAGESYVIFGKTDGFTNIDLASLNNTAGFKIYGEAPNYDSGFSVSRAGDINGDGYPDIIIGANSPTNDKGSSYVIFGKADNFADIDLASLTMPTGFKIFGEDSDDRSGFSVSSAGDINKDGYADIVIGAPVIETVPTKAGKSYMIFGKADNFADIDLASLTMPTGFKIFGENIGDHSGASVSGAGDINKDGYGDIMIGAPGTYPLGRAQAGTSYVVFGKPNGFTDLDLASLAMPVGFKVFGENADDLSGTSVSGAGDINKDGYDDMIIGATYASPLGRDAAGTGYMIFGKPSGFADLDLASLTMPVGFKIYGESNNALTGGSVSSAGDVNKDSYIDIIIGAYNASPLSRGFAGASYVIFGKASGFMDIDLASLTVFTGFKVYGEDKSGQTGISVSSAGDINKDGYDDMIIGAWHNSPLARNTAGESYIIFGNSTFPDDTSDSSSSTDTIDISDIFFQIVIPVVSGIAGLISIIYTLNKCKNEGMCCFKKSPTATLATALLLNPTAEVEAAQIDIISGDNTIYYEETNEAIDNNEVSQALDY